MHFSSVAIPALLGLAAPAAAQQFGAAPVGPAQVIATGTTQLRAVADHLGDTIKAVNFGGCTWDGAHDVSLCIQAAINAAATRGGGEVQLPAGNWPIGRTILLQSNGVILAGQGHGGGQNPTTRLKWIGAAGGTMVQLGISINGTQVWRGGIRGIFLECNHASATPARRGLYAVNLWASDVDVFVNEPYVAGTPAKTAAQPVAIELDGNINLSNLRLAWNMQSAPLPSGAAIQPINTYTQLQYPAGLWIHGGFQATPGGNDAYDRIEINSATSAVGVPVQVDWSDHLLFGVVNLNTAGNATANPHLLGPGMLFNNAQTISGWFDQAPGGHSVQHYQAAAPIWVQGTGTSIIAPQGLNIAQVDLANGTPPPVIGAGTTVSWNDDVGAIHRMQTGDLLTVTNNSTYSQQLSDSARAGGYSGPLLVGSQGSNTLANWYGSDGPGAGFWWQHMDKVAAGNYNLVFQNVGFGAGSVVVPSLQAGGSVAAGALVSAGSVTATSLIASSGGYTATLTPNSGGLTVNAGNVTFAGGGTIGTFSEVSSGGNTVILSPTAAGLSLNGANMTLGAGSLSAAATSAGVLSASSLQVTPSTPASASAACAAGQITADTSYIYVCTATNTWKSEPLLSYQSSPVTSLGGATGAIALSADFSMTGNTLGIVSTIPPSGLVASNGAATLAPTLNGLSFNGTALSLALPTASAMGGVQANAGSAGQFVTGISTSTGALTYSSLPNATSSAFGTVKTDAVTTVANSGIISAQGLPPKHAGWPRSGAFYVPDSAVGAAIGTGTPVAGRYYAAGFFVPAGGATLKTLNVNFTVAPTAGSWSGCIYKDNGSGQPGNLFAGSDTGNGSNATTASTGIKTLTYSSGLALTGPAWYWATIVFASGAGTVNTAAASTAYVTPAMEFLGQASAASAISAGLPEYYSTTNDGLYGACPSSFGTAAGTAGAPMIAMGY